MKIGCIFDLDGTLVDSIDDLGNSCNEMLIQLGFPTYTTEDYRVFVGNGVKKLVERTLPKDKMDCFDEALKLFYEIYEQKCLENTKCYSGIIDLLTTLKLYNIPVAVVSNKPNYLTRKIVDALFKDLVSVAYGQMEGIAVKPNPELVIKAAKELNIDITKSFYIGDSDVDIYTAKNAKMISIGCTWGNRGEKELVATGANYLARKAEDILTTVINECNFIMVSDCLLGTHCKYNGGHNYNEKVVTFLNHYNYVAICPEQLGGLSTPRKPSEILNDRVINIENEDVTKQFKLGAKKSVELVELLNIKYALLKAKSPSCGNELTYDGSFSKTLIKQDGITVQALKKLGVLVFDETQIDLLENTINNE